MINSIFVIGKPGSGKTIIVWYLSSLLQEDGFRIKYYSDRLGLEEAVMLDIKGKKPNADGTITGDHSKLIADGPPGHKKVHVLDGVLLNSYHQQIIKKPKQAVGGRYINLIEYAIGPVINFGKNKVPLLQNCQYFVKWLKKSKVLKKIFVIDIDAPLKVREVREAKRPDAMAMETFRSYFPDGGEMTKTDAQKLGKYYYKFKNLDDDHEGYFTEARFLYEEKIKPLVI